VSSKPISYVVGEEIEFRWERRGDWFPGVYVKETVPNGRSRWHFIRVKLDTVLVPHRRLRKKP